MAVNVRYEVLLKQMRVYPGDHTSEAAGQTHKRAVWC